MARRRFLNPIKPATALILATLAGAGIYAWSESAKAKEKKKKKKATTTNKVQLVESLDELLEVEPPWLFLLYCDNETGRGTLDQLTSLGKSTSKDVQLFATSTKTAAQLSDMCEPYIASNLEDGTQIVVPGIDGLLFGMRVKGSWLEIVAGEDQEELALVRGGDHDAKIRASLAWAAGEGDLPVERSVYIGDPEPLWVDWTEQPPVIQTKIGNVYEIPIPLPDPQASYTLSNSDELAIEAMKSEQDVPMGPIKAGTHLVNLTPFDTTVAAIISVQQGDWKKQALVRVKGDLPLPPVPTP